MPFNGSGTFTIGTAGNPVQDGTTIDPIVHHATLVEIAAGLSLALCRDGQSTVTSPISLNTNRLISVGFPNAMTDAASVLAMVVNYGTYVATVGGTVDAITLTPVPALTAYQAGVEFLFIAAGANTGAVTVNVSGLGAKALTKNGATALSAADIASGAMVRITYDGTRFQKI